MNPGAPPPPYLAALAQSAMSKPPGPPGGANPNGPPPPTGIGAMNTGDAATTPREAASAAVMALRAAQKHFPSVAPAIEGWVSQLIQAAKPQGAPLGGPPPGATPPAPAPAMPPVPSLDDAGPP